MLWAKIKAFFQSFFVKPTGPDPKPPEMRPVIQKLSTLPSISTKSPRTLPKKLEDLIDAAILKKYQSEISAAIAGKDANRIVGLCAEVLADMGVREKSNSNDGELVELIQKTAGGQRGYAWCMYFVMACVAYAEKKLGIVSKIYASGSCASVRSKSSSMAISYKSSKYGDVWIWIHKNGTGHTGIFEKWIVAEKSAVMNEGNTTAGKIGGEIVREGGGAYQTERAVELSSSSNMRLGMVIRAF